MVVEIQAAAEAENLARNRKPMGVASILAQDRTPARPPHLPGVWWNPIVQWSQQSLTLLRG